jgi:hypothetical protein
VERGIIGSFNWLEKVPMGILSRNWDPQVPIPFPNEVIGPQLLAADLTDKEVMRAASQMFAYMTPTLVRYVIRYRITDPQIKYM